MSNKNKPAITDPELTEVPAPAPIKVKVIFVSPGFKVGGERYVEALGDLGVTTDDVVCVLGGHTVLVNRHSLIVAGVILLK